MADGSASVDLPEGVKRASALMERLLKDSKLGPDVRKLAKEAYPDVEFPEDRFDAQLAPVRELLETTQKELREEREARAAEAAKAAERAQENDMRAKLDAAVQKYSLTADGAQKMVDRMKESGNVSDFEAAAAWVAGQQPRAAEPGPYLGPQNINLFGTAEKDERFAMLHQDPMGKFLDAEFREFSADPDAYVRSAGFAA